MKLKVLIGVIVFGILYFLWVFASAWVDVEGSHIEEKYTAENEKLNALIVFNSDPIYNLDEQVCRAFAEEFKKHGISSTLVTNTEIYPYVNNEFDVFVFCANTYNFSPDNGVKRAIKLIKNIENVPAVAITLGTGGTKSSKKKFEYFLECRNVDLIGSKSYWLKKQNDASNTTQNNVTNAVNMAKKWASEIALNLK